MAVPIDATGQFNAGVPQALFRTGALILNTRQVYAATKDIWVAEVAWSVR